MDAGESRAKKFLEYFKPDDGLIHHPNGENHPPDFSLSNVAVEVRRLIKLHHDEKLLVELTVLQASLLKNLHLVISKYDLVGKSEHSYLVYYRFQRPLNKKGAKVDWKRVSVNLKSELNNFFSKQPLSESALLEIDKNLSLRLYRSEQTYPPRLIEVGYSDLDANGFYLADMAQSINYCLSEKTIKIESFYKNYPEWWLVLINHFPFEIDESELNQIQQNISPKGVWSRIFLVNPSDSTKYFEINQN